MPRKLSIKGTIDGFDGACNEIASFLEAAAYNSNFSDDHLNFCYDHAIIRAYRAFEGMILWCLVGAINNDTATITAKTGFAFPKHLTDEVCFFLVTGTGYFDFKGRDGLIKTLRQFLPDDHYLVDILKKARYKQSLEQLCTLRNYAAHESPQSKRAALKAIGLERVGSAGSWLRRQGRYDSMVRSLTELGDEIRHAAPY
jgi:hypothetical protein